MLSFFQNFKTPIQALLILFLLGVVTVVYFPVFRSDFTNWDDNEYVTENPVVSRISLPHLKEIFTTTYVKTWHPLTMFTYMVEGHFFGKNPFVYHTTSLILHLANTFLVGYLLQLLIPVRMAWGVAVLFGIHPMHVESVAWIAERKDVLFAFFYLLGLIQYLLFIKSGRLKFYVFTLFFFVLSGLSKVTAVSFPLIVVLMDVYHQRKISLRLIMEKIPLFLVSLILGIIILKSHSDVLLERTKYDDVPGLLGRIQMSTYALLFYIGKIFVPENLSAIYPYPKKIEGVLPKEYFVSPVIFLVLVIVWFLWWRRSKDKDVFFGGSFFLLTIFFNLPFSVIGAAITADRYVYLPCIGIFILLIKAMFALGERFSKRIFLWKVLTVIFVFYVGWLSFLTYQRCLVWQNSVILWNDTIAKHPKTGFLYYNRGNTFFDEGKYQQAIDDYTQALALSTVYMFKDIYSNRGSAFAKMGRYSEAVADFSASLAIKKNHEVLYHRAGAYLMSGDLLNALADVDEVLRLNPHLGDGYNLRGTLKLRKNDPEGALLDFNKTIELEPRRKFPYYARSRILLSQGNFSQALQDAETARQLGFSVEEGYIEFLKKAASFRP